MLKAMILLTRRPGLSHEDFVRWWLDIHRARAMDLPNLRRLVFNVVDASPAEGSVDGIAELWFDTRAAFDAAYATELGTELEADSLAHASGRLRLFVTEASPVSGG